MASRCSLVLRATTFGLNLLVGLGGSPLRAEGERAEGAILPDGAFFFNVCNLCTPGRLEGPGVLLCAGARPSGSFRGAVPEAALGVALGASARRESVRRAGLGGMSWCMRVRRRRRLAFRWV